MECEKVYLKVRNASKIANYKEDDVICPDGLNHYKVMDLLLRYKNLGGIMPRDEMIEDINFMGVYRSIVISCMLIFETFWFNINRQCVFKKIINRINTSSINKLKKKINNCEIDAKKIAECVGNHLCINDHENVVRREFIDDFVRDFDVNYDTIDKVNDYIVAKMKYYKNLKNVEAMVQNSVFVEIVNTNVIKNMSRYIDDMKNK
jgi:sporulation protein YlmC with PRC-barrel domain